ncbi:MAG: hypothetical protein A2W61_01290 [Deltaproteobacteria bacterium RIFCSPLOWO2_01_44_7]|nr:MAG: hypothetical protein A2712_02400 [Deltaproteobacteria bacterium RIFCSPHIGHO2_01_FULL_43_49]OGQ39012.1 MAG: hypothetical protein A2W61_01290 [Deltaproteobacteria bacterium RIFCSPLOWO2_01_44_7]
MCNIWKEHKRDEVRLSYFGTLPQSLRIINITGGEPFMREDLPEVIRVINERCHHPRMIISTNGFNTKKIREKMTEIARISGRIGVRVSVDGYEKTHDEVRRIPGGFQKCMNTIEALKQIGIKDLGLSFTISPINLGDVAKVYYLTRRLKIQFTLTIAQNSEFYFKTDANTFDLDPDQLRQQFNEFIASELKAIHPKRWFRAYYDKGVYEYGLGKRVLKNCSAGSDFFFSSAKGEIYPCPVLNQKMGDAKNNSFKPVWTSDKANEIRKISKDCPVKCWMTCTVKPHFKQNIVAITWWVVRNKIKAHLSQPIL